MRAAGLLEVVGVAAARAAAMPLAMCTMPSTPNSSAAQPMTWRPAGPLRSGSRRLRQADEARAAAARTSRPGRPSRRRRCGWRHRRRRAAATRRRRRRRRRGRSGTARPRRGGARARGRGRCARSCGRRRRGRGRRRARPRPRPRPRASPSAAIGPGPLRTARGAGRVDFASTDPSRAGLLRDWLPDDRVEDPDPFEPARAAGLEVLLLRDAGGEDVRVAMLANLHRCHSSPRPHTPDRDAPTWAVHGTRPIAGSLRPMSHPHLELSAPPEAAQERSARRRPGRAGRDRPQHDGLRARRQAADRRLRRAVPRGAPARHRRDPPRLHLDPGPARQDRRRWS